MSDTVSLIPVSNDHDQVVTQPVDKEPVIPTDVIKDHPPRLSKNMKLSMRHLGVVENAIPVSEEWTFQDGAAVAPAGRTEGVLYTKSEAKKYSNYGNVEYVNVEVYKDDPAKEVVESIKVTAGTQTDNDDPQFVDAVAPIAVNRQQAAKLQLEGRHGEVSYDPISEENYLTRPGMEVKTSETYMDIVEKEAETEEPAPEEPAPASVEGEGEKSVAAKASSAKTVKVSLKKSAKTEATASETEKNA